MTIPCTDALIVCVLIYPAPMHSQSVVQVQGLLDIAQQSFETAISELKLRARVIRKVSIALCVAVRPSVLL